MKIGILTFHCAHNYGAVLQAYGLQEYLKSCGHEVEVIDYRPTYLTRRYEAFPRSGILHNASLQRWFLRLGTWLFTLPKRVLDLPIRIKRKRNFERFISKKLNLSRERFDENGQVPADKYDAIVFGSDQIWSPSLTDGGDPIFLGDFPAPAGTLKIAYAASAGAASATLGENPVFANALRNFSALSVREDNLGASLQPKTDLKIETVLDPTLLVDKSVWDKLAEPPKTHEKYILIYQISYNREANRIAKELAAQLDAKIVEIGLEVRIRQWDKTQKFTETPEQFVGWFKNATCVITTSFHGTVFSLIFKKPFYYVGNGNAGENRPKQILNALGLSAFYISGDTPCPKLSEINYAHLTEKYNVLLKRSRVFLDRALAPEEKR